MPENEMPAKGLEKGSAIYDLGTPPGIWHNER